MIVEFIRKKSFEGGAGTFQGIFEEFLKSKSHKLVYFGQNVAPDICFVISGTKHIFHLFSCKFRGVKIIQRLDGFNWRNKIGQDSLLNITKMNLQNFIMNYIRKYLADVVVYQSVFVERSWNKKFGKTKKISSVILNCAGKNFFQKPDTQNLSEYTITCVEGHIQDDQVTRNILSQLNRLNFKRHKVSEVEIYGKVKNSDFFRKYQNIHFKGHIDRSEVSGIYKNKKRIFFCLEINPPCPNSLIEAIASQIPCVGFDTGSFREIVLNAGVAIPYDADPWLEDTPNHNIINDYIIKAIGSYEQLSLEAKIIRARYKSKTMCDSYYKLINE